jgi:hypothetical protein
MKYYQDINDEKEDSVEYSDKDIQVSTQIAYMDIPMDIVDIYRTSTDDTNGYPTLLTDQIIITDNQI